MESNKNDTKEINAQSSLVHSMLKIWHCHCSGISLSSGPGTSTFCRLGHKKKKKKKSTKKPRNKLLNSKISKPNLWLSKGEHGGRDKLGGWG